MNAKIKELAEQAKIWQPTQPPNSWIPGEYIAAPHELKKFAELIVKECMEVGDKALQDGKWPGDVLKEHFGVE